MECLVFAHRLADIELGPALKPMAPHNRKALDKPWRERSPARS